MGPRARRRHSHSVVRGGLYWRNNLASWRVFAQASRMLLAPWSSPDAPQITIPGVGTVKHLSDVQILKVRRCCRNNKHQLLLALSCGMTLKRFNRLPAEQREQVRRAVLMITSPSMASRRGPRPSSSI
jgi:hypothetical protein